MHIALLTDGVFPYVIGGMQKHSYYLVKYLCQNQIYVDLFHFNQSNLNIDKLEVFTDEEKKYLNARVLKFPKHSTLPGHYIRESYEYSEIIFDSIKNDLGKYDFIYCKGFAGWKLIKEKRKGLSCPPIGVKFHGLNMFQSAYSFKNKLELFILRKPALYNMKNADYVFSYGGKITDLTGQIGIENSKIIEIPTGVDNQWIINNRINEIKSNEIINFLFIGRYDKVKGILELNNAIDELNKKNEKFIFHFIGPIPEDKKLHFNNIKYHGQISDVKQIQNVLQMCDVLVCPSHSEGMPNVILEAMAMGLAVIASDVGAINKMVDSSNGLLVSQGNKVQLENALIQYIGLDKSILLSQKIASVKKINNEFKWDIIVEKLNAQITKIIKISR